MKKKLSVFSIKKVVLSFLIAFSFHIQAQNIECYVNKTIHIKKGEHYDTDFNFYRNIMLNSGSNFKRTSMFDIKFNNNCAYDLGNANQADWNKAMGIVSLPAPNYTSVRLGWRYNTTSTLMELGLYGHISHTKSDTGREFLQIAAIPLNTFTQVELYMANNGMYAVANGNGVAIKRDISTNIAIDLFERTAIKRDAFFGGQEKTPHQMSMDIQNHCSDLNPFWNAATNKGYTRSIFYTGETVREYAQGTITASMQAERGQDSATGQALLWEEANGERYTTIMPGADVEFRACERIVLQPGFKALAGSNFRAVINCTSNVDDPFNRVAPPDAENLVSKIETIEIPASFDESQNHSSPTTIESKAYEAKVESAENDKAIEKTIAVKFAVFPNPSSGIFNLEFSSGIPFSYEITDLLGKVLETNRNGNRIDLSGYSNGIYILKLKVADKLITRKLIKN